MKYLLLLILLIPNFAKSATLVEKQERTYTNLLQNAGFENGIAKWTPSVSSTVSQVTGSLALIEAKSLRFTATAASQTVQSALYALPTGLVNGDCESSILYQTNSSVYSMRVLNASGAVLSQQSLPAVSNAVTAKMFFPCSVNSTTSLRSDLISSATASGTGITWDQNHLGSLISLKNGAVVEAEQSYTPTLTGFGTVTNVSFRYARVGDRLHVRGVFTAGTVTAVELRLSLPNNFIVDPNKVTSLSLVGSFAQSATTSTFVKTVLAEPNVSYVTFGAHSTTQADLAKVSNGTTSINSNAGFSVNFSVPIVGFTGSSTTFDSVCPNDISCQNTFSAKISATAVVSDENLDFLSTCSVTGGTFTCNFNTGIFTVAPNCTATANRNGASDNTIRINTISASAINYTIGRDGVSDAAGPIVLSCQKQGADFKAKVPIEGFMSKVATSGSGLILPRFEFFSVGQVGARTTACTVSPCGTFLDSGITPTVTRSALGVFPVTYPAGTFSNLFTCVCSALDQGTGGNRVCTFDASSATSGQFRTTLGQTGASEDRSFQAMCFGPR